MSAAPDANQVKAGLDIEERSFAIIDGESPDRERFSSAAWTVARRMIHAVGDISIGSDLALPDDGIKAAVAALKAGAPIWTDSRMAAAGMSLSKLRAANPAYASLPPRSLYDISGVREEAERRGITRSYAAVERIADQLPNAIVAIGNAPTALEAVLDLCAARGFAPRVVIGMPVGFVGAAESKERLIAAGGIPYLSVRGRRGGSSLAAAAINALAALANAG